jgi:RNA polymerase sigma factor (TIGR02999 family)
LFRGPAKKQPRTLAGLVAAPDNRTRAEVMTDWPDDVTRLVEGARQGDEAALAALMPLVYDELRRLAASYLRRERPGHTLQPTALVHDVYVRLMRDAQLSWQNRAHFFGIAARSMRQILVERSRARGAAKRGGSPIRVTLDEGLVATSARSLDIEALDEALTRLAAFDPDLARLVDVRFFGGLSIEEAAEALDISPATVKRRWLLAKAWLSRAVAPESAGVGPARARLAADRARARAAAGRRRRDDG